jgi:hypothetical protein
MVEQMKRTAIAGVDNERVLKSCLLNSPGSGSSSGLLLQQQLNPGKPQQGLVAESNAL